MAVRTPPPPTRFGPSLLQRKSAVGVAPPPTRFGPSQAPTGSRLPVRPVAPRQALQLMNSGLLAAPTGKIKLKTVKAKKHKKKNGYIFTEHSGIKISANVVNSTSKNYEVGFLQAVMTYAGVEKYSNGRTYTYSFTSLPIKDAENASDVFYDSKSSKIVISYNSATINMNDQPDGVASWEDPKDSNANLTRITRRQTFFVWLWAREVGVTEYIVLDTAQWGFDCTYDFQNSAFNDAPIYTAASDPGLQGVATQNSIANGSGQCVISPP